MNNEIEKIVKQNNECPHCKFLYETFLRDSNPYSGERDYYLMTEVFVYLHNGDDCSFNTQNDKGIKIC